MVREIMPGLMPGLMMDRPLLVTPLLEFAAQYHADTAIITRSIEGPLHRTTYAETWTRVQKLANALVALGVKPGDRVATLGLNTWRHLELYFAVAGIGAVCHTLNPRLSQEHLRFIVNHAEDSLLFFDIIFAEAVAQCCPHAPTVRAAIALTDAAHLPKVPIKGLAAYEDLIAAQPGTYDFPTFDENTAASLCYTSGTTGVPKGVLYSHRALVLHSMSIMSNLWLDATDIALPVVPMFHVNAWGMPYAAPMAGTALILPGMKLDGPSLFELMDSEGVTCSQGVPTVWMALLQAMQQQGRKPRALESVLVGGSAVPQAIIEAFEYFGVEVIHAWGMTETTPLGVINKLKPKFKKQANDEQMRIKLKQGRAVAGVDMRVVDAEGTILPHDGASAGHLQVRGPWIAQSYYRSDVPAVTPDGWFDTGDIATICPDGYMHITDRAKDIIKSGGEWISSVDLENAVMGHPKIAHAAVIGLPHHKWQERPLLICVPKGDDKPTLDEVHAYLETKVPKWWLPDAVAFIDALPIGPTGKIQKTKLRERFPDWPG